MTMRKGKKQKTEAKKNWNNTHTHTHQKKWKSIRFHEKIFNFTPQL